MALISPALPELCRETVLQAGTDIFRIHRADKGPVFFGPASASPPANRFDAPNGEFGTLYAAEDLAGCFVETILRRANRIIRRSFVNRRAWSELRLVRDVRLVQLHGEGLIHHGVTADICAGDLYADAQALALQLYQKYGIDGIAYRARHNNDEICYAICDRVNVADLAVVKTFNFADAPDVADELLWRHGAAWDTSGPPPDLEQAG